MGRPREEIDLNQVEKLAMYDFSLEEMAVVLGVHHATLYRRLANPETQKDFQDALDRGRAKLRSRLKSKLIEEALKANPNTAALIFLNKNYSTTSDGKPYSDRQTVEHKGQIEHAHTLSVNMSIEDINRRIAELMQDEEIKRLVLTDGAKTIDASFDQAVISGTGSTEAHGTFSAAAVGRDADSDHTTREASADHQEPSRANRGDRSRARTRRTKSTGRRKRSRSRAQKG